MSKLFNRFPRWKKKSYPVNNSKSDKSGGSLFFLNKTEKNKEVQLRHRSESYPVIPSLKSQHDRKSIYIEPEMYQENTHWRKEAMIGAGMFGECYQALDVLSGTLMAVKRVTVPVGETSITREDFKAEIELLGSLTHENIVRILGATEEPSYFNIFLEWMPGGSISSLLNKFGPFHELVIIKYTKQVLTGLAYLHDNKILHRDLKGANILVDGSGQHIRISDFGTAVCLKTQVTVEGEFIGQVTGTLPFMAPEVVRGENYGRSSDIWSVGCVIIEMATARLPWNNSAIPVTNYFQLVFLIAQTKEPPQIPDSLSSSTRSLAQKCLKLTASARPSAKHLLEHPSFSILNTNFDFAQLSVMHHFGGRYHYRESCDKHSVKGDRESVDSGSCDQFITSDEDDGGEGAEGKQKIVGNGNDDDDFDDDDDDDREEEEEEEEEDEEDEEDDHHNNDYHDDDREEENEEDHYHDNDHNDYSSDDDDTDGDDNDHNLKDGGFRINDSNNDYEEEYQIKVFEI